MTHLNLMQVLDTSQDLMEEAAGLSVLQTALLYNVIEELATRGILHDQKQLLARLDYFIKLHDVGVANDFQDMDFSHDTRNVRLVLNHIFLKDLDSHLLMSQLMDTLSDFAECALADCLSDKVVAN